jgi:hypothetical protein
VIHHDLNQNAMAEMMVSSGAKLLEHFQKTSNFIGNINNWNQSAKSVQTQNRLFHFTSLMEKTAMQHVLNQNAMTETMVASDVSFYF